MTLIIFTRCKDGFIIISDRKETEYNLDQGNDVQKSHLSENEEYFLALAGDARRANGLLAELSKRNDVNSTNVITEASNFVKSNYAEYGQDGEIDGFLITNGNGRFKFYHIAITRDNFIPTTNSSHLYLRGNGEAIVIAKHLLRNVNLENYPHELACKHLIAVMRDVAESATKVGKLEEYGFDITVFLDSGKILHRIRYTETDAERIKTEFEINAEKAIFSGEGAEGE